MKGKEVGEILHDIWREDKSLYRAVMGEAQRRLPIVYNNGVPENIGEVRSLAVRVHREYQRGEITFDLEEERRRICCPGGM